MDVNDAIQIINDSDRQPDEKSHLRRLVSSGGILPARFNGNPNYDEILADFPVTAGKNVCNPIFTHCILTFNK
jgi:hypothetical protein